MQKVAQRALQHRGGTGCMQNRPLCLAQPPPPRNTHRCLPCIPPSPAAAAADLGVHNTRSIGLGVLQLSQAHGILGGDFIICPVLDEHRLATPLHSDGLALLKASQVHLQGAERQGIRSSLHAPTFVSVKKRSSPTSISARTCPGQFRTKPLLELTERDTTTFSTARRMADAYRNLPPVCTK